MATKKPNLPKIDKRQLFFDRNRKNYIEFDFEQLKTCQEIYNSLHEEIDKNIFYLVCDSYEVSSRRHKDE